jgi:hypothetical protein
MSELERLIRELQATSTELARARGVAEQPILHGPPAGPALSAAIEAMTLPPPPSYREFLEHHNGWERFWNRFNIVGVDGAHTVQAREDIAVSLDADVQAQQRSMPEEAARRFVDREARRPNFVHLPNHLIFATDLNGQLAFFDHRTRRDDGEMEVRLWSPAGITERHPSLIALLQSALGDASAQLQRVRRP